ncbi:hypothetical protein CR513_18562, partial [Mucuna pruriens]
MEPPHGLIVGNFGNKLCKLKESLNGLKQSSRAWFERFTKVLTRLGHWSSCSRQRQSRYGLGRDLSSWSRLSADRRNGVGLTLFQYLESMQFPHSSSQSISALRILMTIAKGSSIVIPRNYAIATSSVGKD